MSSEINKRARSGEQKAHRRLEILKAADALFLEMGFEAFTMAKLATASGVAKGTLYLYFQTREEVLLALVDAKMADWGDNFGRALYPGVSARELATLCFDTVQADPALLPLLIRLDSVIEHNVSMDVLIQSKRVTRDVLTGIAQKLARVLDLTQAQGFELIAALGVLIVGAAHVDQGPVLEGEKLPEDIRDLINAFSSKDLFIANAIRIINGIAQADT